MVSNVPTFSGKLIGQKIAREYVLPVFVPRRCSWRCW